MHDDKWAHRECREYSFLLSNTNYYNIVDISIDDYSDKTNQCEQCWVSTGSMIKCIVPTCKIKSHLFCAKIKRKVYEIYMIPVSIYIYQYIALFLLFSFKT